MRRCGHLRGLVRDGAGCKGAAQRGHHHEFCGRPHCAVCWIVVIHFYWLTWKVVVAPVNLSIVVMVRTPFPTSTTLMVKLSVSSVPGTNLPSGPTICELAAEARRLKIDRSSVSLNCCKGVFCSMPKSSLPISGSLWRLVAKAELSSTEPFSGLPPNDGFKG